MCYDDDAAPPRLQPPITGTRAAAIRLTSSDGTSFAAYEAHPDEVRGPGVVILPDLRGLHEFYKQLAVRLAEQGHPAVAIDYYGRTATDDDRGESFSLMAHVGKLTREGIQSDLRAAADHLGGPAVALGFCMGGRNAFFASDPRFGFAGVIGFYGAPGIAGPYGPGPTQHAAELGAPILGLFGGADEGIPAEAVAEFDQALTAAGVEHEIVTYPGAPHGFFDAAHAEHAAACENAWKRVLAFLASH
ncbi:dienelactone hydrolase family protein [Nonomuraea angiospora]|uniref:Carboxymethylenebutenolidase n=1 Tax=Nonomuraea angiospora TaxID=46172 RepID=A0ABR9M031_9ACTN|nr:dienelactone hydrolase family protein [Nonomuraea angiospora]MBE1586250.1 carboxymethylenebutenolidase [Nonomuraea angiospora]